jgi:hypothetical protein
MFSLKSARSRVQFHEDAISWARMFAHQKPYINWDAQTMTGAEDKKQIMLKGNRTGNNILLQIAH